jgi:DNA end-binding protein Ku
MASAIWRGFITFGLLSIPVRLFRAARAERVSLRRLCRAETPRRSTAARPQPEGDDTVAKAVTESAKSRRSSPPEPVLTPVQQVSIRKGSDEVLPEKSIVKGFEYEKDRYVVVEPEELKSIAPKTATEMQIEEFVTLAEVDPIYFETSYYVVPEDAGQKAYALLYRSLQVIGLVAVAQLAMREHVVSLRPGGKGLIAHTMFFTSEVRADEEYAADTRTVTQKELHLAETLIHSLEPSFQPEKFRDTYRERLESIIARRVAGQAVATPEKPSPTVPVVDITEALQKSLAALKKPAASEEQPRRVAKSTGTRRKKASTGAG